MQAFNVKKYLNFTHNKIYNDRHKGNCAIGTTEISQVLVCAYTTKDISQSSVLLIFCAHSSIKLIFKTGPILSCIIKGWKCNTKKENVQH